ncbi:hypothetical protein [Streptomyces sp. NPDC021969]|uniref:hypothetical protein n=1 Tax=unclassified Streptomyces TaxID=2593676 RepID=UPI0033C18DE9
MQKLFKRITDENVQDIVDTASYGGITYWAISPNDEEFAGLPEGKEYTIVEGSEPHPIFPFDDVREVDAVFYLSKDDVRLAFCKLLDPGQELVNDEINGYILDAWRDRTEKDGIDAGHIDASAADAIIQVACFDELRYG